MVKIPRKKPSHEKSVSPNNTIAEVQSVSLKDTLTVSHYPYYSEFHNSNLLNNISILPNKHSRNYTLSGIILEKDSPGILYHAIGVNGAKASDFNKYSLFFDQLAILKPDLVIISFGTNESFGKLSASGFLYQINKLVKSIKEKNKNTIVMVMTPPPSLLKRKLPNTLLNDYSKELLKSAEYVVWNMLAKMGGINAPAKPQNIALMAKDKIHYSKEGYKMQGNLFSADFMNAYNNYIKAKSSYEHDFR